MSYHGKNVWIIGASSGIGRALADTLAARGAKLALSARRADALDAAVNQLGPAHRAFTFDASDTDAFVATAGAVQQHFGRIDYVVFLAAIYEPGSIEKMDIAAAHDILRVNLGGTLNCLHAVLPHLRRQRGGQLALCGSVAGYRGLPNAQPYAATKAAVMSLAETAALEETRHGVDIRLISPGFVRTPMTDKNSFHMPMMVAPEEAAAAIADGLLSSSFEIHFPRVFTYAMKFLASLPYIIYLRILRR